MAGYLLFATGPFFFILMVLAIIIYGVLTGDNSRFMKLQAVLPTSKIRSMAMGLVEVQGKAKAIESLAAPINSKRCVGYHYTVESIKTDSDGKKSYTTVYDELKCNAFMIEDESGSVKVLTDKLNLIMFPVDEQYIASSRRHTQYVLYNDEEVLLVGKAALENDTPVLMYEEIKDVFGLSPVLRVNRWNKFKLLRSTLLMYIMVLAFLVGVIFMLDITEVDGNIVIALPQNIFSWDFIK